MCFIEIAVELLYFLDTIDGPAILHLLINHCYISVYMNMEKREWKDHTEVACIPLWPDSDMKSEEPLSLRQFYYTMLSVLLFFLPMTIMTFVYAAIIMKLQTQQSQITELNNNPQKIKNSSRKRASILITSSEASNYFRTIFFNRIGGTLNV